MCCGICLFAELMSRDMSCGIRLAGCDLAMSIIAKNSRAEYVANHKNRRGHCGEREAKLTSQSKERNSLLLCGIRLHEVSSSY